MAALERAVSAAPSALLLKVFLSKARFTLTNDCEGSGVGTALGTKQVTERGHLSRCGLASLPG